MTPNLEIGKIRDPPENPTTPGTDVHQMTVIDEITVHDGTVTAIIEEEMTGGKETTGGSGLREIAAGIVIAGMRIAEGVLRILTSDGIPWNLPIVRPMALPVPERHLILIEKRAKFPHHLGKLTLP